MQNFDREGQVDERVHRLSKLFDVLSNAVRLQILFELEGGELCVKEVGKKLDRNPDAISRHLKTLRDNDLVSSTTRSNYRYYSLKRPDLLEEVLEFYSLLTRKKEKEE